MQKALFLILLLTPAARAAETSDFKDVAVYYSEVSYNALSFSISGAGRCSGTFITPRLMLTAAHCVADFNSSRMGGRITRTQNMRGEPVPDRVARPDQVYMRESHWYGDKKIHPRRVFVSPLAVPVMRGDLSLSHVEMDLAIIEWGSDSKHTREISTSRPLVGDSVVMAGFGRHGGGRRASAKRHYGENTIERLMYGLIFTNGSAGVCSRPGDHFNDWSTCGGDSGGALIDKQSGKLIGVVSATIHARPGSVPGEGQRSIGVFIDVTGGVGADFVEETLRAVGSRR